MEGVSTNAGQGSVPQRPARVSDASSTNSYGPSERLCGPLCMRFPTRTPPHPPKDRSREAHLTRMRLFFAATGAELLATCIYMFAVTGFQINFRRIDATVDVASMENVATSAGIGLTVLGLSYSFASLSGAHVNPSITFAAFIAGKISNRRVVAYIIAQLIGSAMGAGLGMLVFPQSMDHASSISMVPLPGITIWRVLLVEFMLSFTGVFTLFTVAFDLIEEKEQEIQHGVVDADGNLTLYNPSPISKTGFAPMCLGLTEFYTNLIGGSVTGGAGNPIRVFAPALFSGLWQYQWAYWLAELSGATCAAMTRKLFVAALKGTNPQTNRFAVSEEVNSRHGAH